MVGIIHWYAVLFREKEKLLLEQSNISSDKNTTRSPSAARPIEHETAHRNLFWDRTGFSSRVNLSLRVMLEQNVEASNAARRGESSGVP